MTHRLVEPRDGPLAQERHRIERSVGDAIMSLIVERIQRTPSRNGRTRDFPENGLSATIRSNLPKSLSSSKSAIAGEELPAWRMPIPRSSVPASNTPDELCDSILV